MPNPSVAEQWARVDRLLDRVLAQAPADRANFVQAQTADNPRLQMEVMALLAEFETRGDLLDGPALTALAGRPRQAELPAGERFGAYRVRSLLGRGGMGEVYLAERADDQFEHRVALKLLRHDAVEHLGRFIAERSILARLQHPGIARLYDAGVSEAGRPYIVMELVEGQTITDWCRQRTPELSVRLALLEQVCDAVSYAHRSLVIHRDLKPGNILVDDRGHVKLLDFGVARLLSTPESGDTGNAPMTPAYAAPEQFTGSAVTTATDIHALGLLLHELLTDRHPRGDDSAPLAVQLDRLLREDVAAPSRVARGLASPPVPARQLVGDLDAIVGKALRRDPAERYASVSDLQADLRRHQHCEAVIARGGARRYVLGRLLRRYRWLLGGVLVLVAVLLAGMASTLWQAREAARERDIARTEAARSDAVRDYMMLMFREAGEEQGEGELTAKQVLERSAAQLMAGAGAQEAQRLEVFQMLGELFAAIDDYEGAAPIFRHYLDSVGGNADPALQAEIRHNLSVAEFRLGNPAPARMLLEQAQAFWNKSPARYRESLASSRVIQSQIERDAGEVDAAIATLRAGLAARIEISGRGHRETAYAMNALGLALMNAGQLAEADRELGEALSIMSALGKQDSANALTMLSNQAVVAAMLGDHSRAEPLFMRAVALRRQLYGRSAALAALQQNLGRLMVRSGRAEAAQPLLDDALTMAREFTGAASPTALTIQLSAAEVRVVLMTADAEAALQEASAAIIAQWGESHVLYARSEQVNARLRLAQGRPAEARAAVDRAERTLLELGAPAAPYLAEVAALRRQLGDEPRR